MITYKKKRKDLNLKQHIFLFIMSLYYQTLFNKLTFGTTYILCLFNFISDDNNDHKIEIQLFWLFSVPNNEQLSTYINQFYSYKYPSSSMTNLARFNLISSDFDNPISIYSHNLLIWCVFFALLWINKLQLLNSVNNDTIMFCKFGSLIYRLHHIAMISFLNHLLQMWYFWLFTTCLKGKVVRDIDGVKSRCSVWMHSWWCSWNIWGSYDMMLE